MKVNCPNPECEYYHKTFDVQTRSPEGSGTMPQSLEEATTLTINQYNILDLLKEQFPKALTVVEVRNLFQEKYVWMSEKRKGDYQQIQTALSAIRGKTNFPYHPHHNDALISMIKGDGKAMLYRFRRMPYDGEFNIGKEGKRF